jgi:hypothetical protein
VAAEAQRGGLDADLTNASPLRSIAQWRAPIVTKWIGAA